MQRWFIVRLEQEDIGDFRSVTGQHVSDPPAIKKKYLLIVRWAFIYMAKCSFYSKL